MADIDDVLQERLSTLRAERNRAKGALDRAKSHTTDVIRLDPTLVEKFGRLMQTNLSTGLTAFRKPISSPSSPSLRLTMRKSGSLVARTFWKRRF